MTSSGRRVPLMPFFESPATAAALAAFALRIASGWQGLSQNPLLTNRQLDAEYYVRWAREIWGGDLASARGIAANGVLEHAPLVLNPLYAYVIAPVVGAFGDPGRSVILFQALLGAASAAMTAVAARRFFGLAAAWTAGLAVALSAVLVQLDAHVAVSGLAAFLTAGAVFASAPPPPDGSGARSHGPVASGLWLGIGALARPITPLALPFFLWRHGRQGGLRRGAMVAAAFAACALPSLLRNWAVSGEPVLYTAASGLNLHLGNNSVSRRCRAMASPWVRFAPVEMHKDAVRYWQSVHDGAGGGGGPTLSEVSSYFSKMARDEFIREPASSALFYAQKARWFLSPVEVPSTASFTIDRKFAPLLQAAFVPTWLLAAAAVVGAIVHRRRRDVLCGPTALLLAHVAVLTLVFPLSHYRSPAIPAMAVLAGGCVHASIAAWRAGERRRTAWMAAATMAAAAAGVCPPQPDPLRHADAMHLAHEAKERGDLDAADRFVLEAIAEYGAVGLTEQDTAPAIALRGEIAVRRGDWAGAVTHLTRALDLQPGNWMARLNRSIAAQRGGDGPLAERDARRVVEELPELPHGHARLGEVLAWLGRSVEAAAHLRYALDHGVSPDPDVLRRLQLR